MHRLKADLIGSENVLAASDWLVGARIIFDEVNRLTGQSPRSDDPTRPFLEWANLLPPPLDSTYPNHYADLGLSFPPNLPNFNPDKLRIPTPPVWNEAIDPPASSSSAPTDQFSGESSPTTPTDAFETRYAPPYSPFVSTANEVV